LRQKDNGETRAPGEGKTASSARVAARVVAKILGWFVIFSLELAVGATAFVVVRMFISREFGPRVRENVRVQGRGVRPQLYFACCGHLSEVQSILSNPAEVADLKDLHAGLAVSISDFTPTGAQIVRRLNDNGIPAIAGIVLPGDQGYYVNAGNAPQTAARFDEFEDWARDNSLQWVAVGLDIEPANRDFEALKQGNKLRFASKLIWRYFDVARVYRARAAYAALIRRIQAQGYSVQTDQMPFIIPDRREHSTMFERLFRVVDVRGNLEAVMIYTSFRPSLDSAMIWELGPDAQAIAVGTVPPLDWDAFSRDLIVASHFTSIVGVYDLEGCVQQGFLPRLETMNWGQSVVIPAQAIQKAALLIKGVQTVTWTLSRLPYFAFVVFLLDALLIWRRRTA
jgi:hypothetical protein